MLKYSTHIDQVFHAFGDPTRLRMVERLSLGPASVSGLAEPLGITLAAVMQHLAILEQSGLVSTRKDGRVRTARLESAGFGVASAWITERRTLWERRLDRLGAVLDEEDAQNNTSAAPAEKQPRDDRAKHKEK